MTKRNPISNKKPRLQPAATVALCLLISVCLPSRADNVEWEQMNEQGLKAMKENNLEDAESIFKKAEEKLAESGHQESDLATVKHHLGELYEKQGNFKDAETYYKEAIELRKESLGEDNLLTARSMVNLGRMYEKERKFDDAAEQFNTAGVIIDKSMGAQYPGVRAPADLVNWISDGVEKDQKVPTHATFEADNLQKKHGDSHPGAAEKLNDLGEFYRAHGNFDQAEELYKRATDLNPGQEPTDPAAAKRFVDLASMYQHQGKIEEAEKYFAKAESVLESSDAGLDKRGTTYNKMAHFYEAKGENDKAEKYYKEALDAREKFSDEKQLFENKGAEKPIAETLSDYAKFLHKVGKDEKADKMNARAHDILESLETP